MSRTLSCIRTNRTTSGFSVMYAKLHSAALIQGTEKVILPLLLASGKLSFILGEMRTGQNHQRCFAKGSLHISGQPDLSQWRAMGPVLAGLHPTMMVEGRASSGPNIAVSVLSIPHML